MVYSLTVLVGVFFVDGLRRVTVIFERKIAIILSDVRCNLKSIYKIQGAK